VYQNGSILFQEAVSSIDSIIFTYSPTTLSWEPEMVTVPGGTTTLNGTTVTIDTFSIGKYEITQKIWEEVMGYSGPTSTGGTLSATTAYPGGSLYMPNAIWGDGDNYPVYYVSYDDIVNIFLPRLRTITGKNFRLPTEAEWEYAAKGGQQTHNYTYSGSNTIRNVAWHNDGDTNSNYKFHVVGKKLPNELGIYDMSGNVWEWCSDWYGCSTYPSSANNPTGASTGSYRVFRGGAWNYIPYDCTVSFRSHNMPSFRDYSLGFRLVLVP
jgi:formylglycine-generating enzyme required for sulfatase activity